MTFSIKSIRNYLLAASGCFLISLTLFQECFAAPSDGQPQEVGNPRLGRLSDGRAYRVDENGYRLVDQIAELEVANDDLRRQIRAMENEVNMLRGNRGNGLSRGTVAETDLLPNMGSTGGLPPARTTDNKAQGGPDCNQLVSSLYLRVSELERELDKTKSENDQIASRQLQVQQSDALRQEQQAQQLNEAERIRVRLEAQLLESNTELAKLREENLTLQAAEKEEEKVQQAKVQPTKSAAAAESRAALARPKPAKKEAARSQDNAGFAIAKREMRGDLARVQSLIMKRKDLLDSVKKRKKGISISIQQLKTIRGESLDALRTRAQDVTSVDEVGSVRRGLGEISGKLDEDIRLLTRLKKGRQPTS